MKLHERLKKLEEENAALYDQNQNLNQFSMESKNKIKKMNQDMDQKTLQSVSLIQKNAKLNEKN